MCVVRLELWALYESLKWYGPLLGTEERFIEIGCQLKKKKLYVEGIIIIVNEIALIIVDYIIYSILGQYKNIKNKTCH